MGSLLSSGLVIRSFSFLYLQGWHADERIIIPVRTISSHAWQLTIKSQSVTSLFGLLEPEALPIDSDLEQTKQHVFLRDGELIETWFSW